MVNQGLLIPVNANAGGTFYDYGRIIALWVSAFEILIHPGGNGKANKHKVFALLESVPWVDESFGHKRYITKKKKGEKEIIILRNLACWIYDQMYTCRNKFLHGDPVKEKDPDLWRSYDFAPILYRLGLTAFLDLSWKEQFPNCDNSESINVDQWEFEQLQSEAETALRQAASKNAVFV